MRNCLLQVISPFLAMFSSCISLLRQIAVMCGNGLIATFQLSSVASFNLGWSQNGVLGKGLMYHIDTHRVENIVRKGGIACLKQFLLFSQCFPQLKCIKMQCPARVAQFECVGLITWWL